MGKLQIGNSFEETFSYSQRDVIAFAQITGDINPLHLDADFAAQTIYKKPIIHGFLSASVFSKILGTAFPGNGTIYLAQNLKFVRPMFVDILYKALIQVKELNPEKHQAELSTRITDSKGKLVIEGTALVMNQFKI